MALEPSLARELRVIAAHYLRRERHAHSLRPTELVNEAYLKIAGDASADERTMFLGLAASAVRQVLVDHARRRLSHKRGRGIRPVTLHEEDVVAGMPAVDVLDLDEALDQLAQLDERQKAVVELRFFAGLNTEEIAALLGVSPRTVKALWRSARAWLIHRLGT